jgi:hypothetical protein
MATSESIRDLIEQIYKLRVEYSRMKRFNAPQRPNPPATTGSIKQLAQLLGRELPEDYQLFLTLYDGWPGYSGENDLLSTTQMLQDMVPRIKQLKALMESEDDKRAAAGFIIGASKYTPQVLYFDAGKTRKDGGLDVVFWEHGPEDRYRSFEAFLKDEVKTYTDMVADEQSKKRPSKTKKK